MPAIQGSTLIMAGTLSEGLILSGIQVWFDPGPRLLTLESLRQTLCYDSGIPVAFLRQPVGPNEFYTSDQSEYSLDSCFDPYSGSPGEPKNNLVPWITARQWLAGGANFAVRADLAEIMGRLGPGVYTIHIRADKGNESFVVSNCSTYVN